MKGRGILIGADGDLMVKPLKDGKGLVLSGLLLGNSVYQNQYIILKSHKGELKEWPALGVGITDMANSNDIAGWSAEIREQLEKDGMRVEKLAFDRNMNLEIDANYESK